MTGDFDEVVRAFCGFADGREDRENREAGFTRLELRESTVGRVTHHASAPASKAAPAAALSAAVLGIGHAAVSAYWAAGGTWLLDTIGGELERWGRERGPSVVIALWLIAVLKAGVAVAAPVLVLGPGRLPGWTTGRAARALSWIAAVVLTGYGGLLTAAGLLVQSGAVDAAPDADRRALAWHAYLWDPWFLGWGLAFLTCLRLTRPGPNPR